MPSAYAPGLQACFACLPAALSSFFSLMVVCSTSCLQADPTTSSPTTSRRRALLLPPARLPPQAPQVCPSLRHASPIHSVRRKTP